MPLIVAPCGDVQNAPESTLTAFEQAILQGADAIEFDVHLTRDGELVIHHDYYLGRTASGQGYLSDYTLAELRALDAGSWFDQRFAGAMIPTLREVLDLGKGKVRFEIDMRGSDLRFLSRVLAEINEFDLVSDVELTSEHSPLLFHLKKIQPELRVGLFFHPLPNWMQSPLGQQHVIDWMTLSDAQVAHLPISLLEPEFVARLQSRGFIAHGSNLNSCEEIQHGLAAGVDQFSTRQLELALHLRG
jgi:glycerophosphoryl diester phosphodiesterase